jgi:hypothetical protein
MTHIEADNTKTSNVGRCRSSLYFERIKNNILKFQKNPKKNDVLNDVVEKISM